MVDNNSPSLTIDPGVLLAIYVNKEMAIMGLQNKVKVQDETISKQGGVIDGLEKKVEDALGKNKK